MSAEHPVDTDPPNSETSQIAHLAALAQSGDRGAFHRLADRFQAEIFRMIFYRVRSKMDAEDLTQDVFFKAFRSIKQLRSPMRFKSWLYRIAVNRVRDYHRRNAIKAMFSFVAMDDPDFLESEEMAVAPEVAERIDQRAFWQQINHMLEELSKMEKEVFLLRFFDGLTIKEISAVMKKNESTVKTHLYRALAKMKGAAARLDEVMEVL